MVTEMRESDLIIISFYHLLTYLLTIILTSI